MSNEIVKEEDKKAEDDDESMNPSYSKANLPSSK
jgi:hypothetical protein